ncbi:MAG: HD-GYP domain-containing protein [Nitrospirae bacterium]|nr:HD-GYP domain-containing protein [Nitrospirota bacterium]
MIKKYGLIFTVGMIGWIFFASYVFYDYETYGISVFAHLFSFDDYAEGLFHLLIIFSPVGSTWTAYLINERRKLLDKTLESERRLRFAANEWLTTFDSMPYGVMMTDNNFNIIRANKYISGLAGRDIKDLIEKGKCCGSVHSHEEPLEGCPLVKSITSNRTEAFFHHNRIKNKYFIESVTPIFDEEDRPKAYVIVIIDVTDIKENEKKLIQSKDAFFNMLKDLDSTYKELKSVYDDLILAFSNVIDAKSHWTRGHSANVAYYARAIAKEMDIGGKEIELLGTASLLHDIGKIGTYDIILDKPTGLSDDEFRMIKLHPVRGDQILKPIKGLKNIRSVIRAHHEKYDGTGYPDGLKGDEIPLLARILCVADSYDAMTSDRPYRLSVSREYAIDEMRRCSGSHFDPEVVSAFLKVLEKESGVSV